MPSVQSHSVRQATNRKPIEAATVGKAVAVAIRGCLFALGIIAVPFAFETYLQCTYA